MSAADTSPWIRVAVPGDAAGIAVLQNRAFDDAWSEDSVGNLLGLPGALSLVATDGEGTVVAFLIGQCVGETAEVVALAVAESGRRRGWASALLHSFETLARGAGAERCLLDVAADNTAALALYGARGYRPIARRHGYYAAGRSAPVDAVVMEIDLA